MAENESQIKRRRLENTGTNQGNSRNTAELKEKTLLENIHEMMLKNQLKQEIFNEEVLKKLRSTEEKVDKISEEQQKMAISISEKSGGTKEKQEIESVDIETPRGSSDTIVTSSAILPTTGKSFVLKHVFDEVLNMEEAYEYYTAEEEHFGVPWEINVSREGKWLTFHLFCPKSLNYKKWSVETKFELKLISKSGNHATKEMNKTFGNANGNMKYDAFGEIEFIEWEKLEKDYVKDDKLTTEIHVHITKMTGIYKDDTISSS